MTSAKKAILATLIYHDIFEYPLTQQEIWKFLVANLKLKTPHFAKALRGKQNSKLPVCARSVEDRQFKIQNYLDKLKIEKKIFEKENFYFLPSRREIVELRKQRKKYSQKKLTIAKKVTRILSKIPFVRMIAITGALAMKNSDKDDDIDFLIITERNRLWLTRLIATLVLEILGKRRRPNDKKFKDKICLNMFLDEFMLSLPKAKHNLFTAHEIVQVKPLFNTNQTYEKFLKANEWVKQHLPNAVEIKQLAIEQLRTRKKRKKVLNYYLLITQLLNSLEKITYHFQLKYMQPKRTTEQVSLHFAFFHPKDTAREVLRKYKDKFSMLQ